MRELPQEQFIHAEKIINDVFYEAQLGTLNRYCSLQIQPQQIYNQTPQSLHHQIQPGPSYYNQPFLQSVPSYKPQMPLSQTRSYNQQTRQYSQHTESQQKQSSQLRNTQLPLNQSEEDEFSDSTSASEYLSNFRTID